MEQNDRKYADRSSADLLQQAGWFRILKWFLGILAVLALVMVVGITVAVMSSPSNDGGGIDGGVVLLVLPGVFLAGISGCFHKAEKGMRAELSRRCRSDKDRAYVEEELKAPVKSIKKVILVIIAIVILTFVIVPALRSCSSNERGGDGITSCKNCGRKTDLVPGFGYCGNCYKGFNEWQDNYYDD